MTGRGTGECKLYDGEGGGLVFVASAPPLRNPFVFQQLRSPPVVFLFPAHRAVEEKYEKGM